MQLSNSHSNQENSNASFLSSLSAKKIFFISLLSPIVFGIVVGIILLTVANSWNFSFSKSAQHIRGNKNAPIKLVEFSDFECPFCARHYPTLKQALAEYGDKISLEYKHFPLGFHQFAQKSAEASECAGEQNKFWEFHDKIFENQKGLSLEKLQQWAQELKLNINKFNQCLESGKFAAKVTADQKEGETLGVNGTPATFVNGKLVSGAIPFSDLKQAIDEALKK